MIIGNSEINSNGKCQQEFEDSDVLFNVVKICNGDIMFREEKITFSVILSNHINNKADVRYSVF